MRTCEENDGVRRSRSLDSCTLDEVADSGRTQTRGQRTSAFGSYDLAEAANKPGVVLHGVQLDACLYDINWAHATVCDRAAQTTSKGAIEVVAEAVLLPVVD